MDDTRRARIMRLFLESNETRRNTTPLVVLGIARVRVFPPKAYYSGSIQNAQIALARDDEERFRADLSQKRAPAPSHLGQGAGE